MFESLVRNGTLLTVVALIVCVLGIVSATRIPVQMIPDLDVRTIAVETGWPGATPQDIEKEILIEQERYLQALPNLQRMKSKAETGRAEIELEFPLGTDIAESLIHVSNALSQVPAYPENVDQPRLLANSFSSNAFLYFRVRPLDGNPMQLDMDLVRDFIDDQVIPRMERIEGVSLVQIRGGADRQVQIRVDPARLAQRGLSLAQVRDAIRARNRDASAGDIDEGNERYLLRTIGRFEDLQALEQLIIDQSGGSYTRLGDVATIKLDHFEVRFVSFANGDQALFIAVYREPGSNVIDIKHEMLALTEQINRDLLEPGGMFMVLYGDDARYVEASIRTVWINLAIGALLASLIMFGFFRSAPATAVGALGIPISTIAAFIGLVAFDRTINVISLAGVAFAIGMTVDNTIVVLESIERKRRLGLGRLAAAAEGAREVWPAVLASSLTTVLVFAPVLFIEEEAGQLYSDIAIAISASILASMAVAIGLIPTASARVGFGNVQDGPDRRSRLADGIAAFSARRSSQLMIVAGVSALFIGGAAALLPAAEYLPEGEEPKAFTRMFAPPGHSMSKMLEVGVEIDARLQTRIKADPESYQRGEESIPPLAYYSVYVSSGGIWMISEPVDGDDIESMMTALTEWFSSFPGMRAFSARGSIITSNDGGTRAVNLDFSGPDQVTLYAAAEAAYQRADDMFDNAQLSSEPSSLSLDQPLIQIRPRWERLAEYGMTASDFGYTVAALSDGAYVDEFFVDDDKVDIFMFSGAGNEQRIRQLSQMPVATPNGGVQPLAAMAELRSTVDSESLRRVDGARTVTLRIIPPRDVALETAVKRVRNELVPAMKAAGEIDTQVSIDLSGAADQLDATRDSLTGNFLIAVILIYLLLVAIFRHWGYPLLILATVPLGLAGGILGLALFNGLGQVSAAVGGPLFSQSFDMITMLGFLILLGTVVNNPILIVDRTRYNLQQEGMDAVSAVAAAVQTRLRPIMMSTLTTVGGLAPLVLIPGAGVELYRGVGVVVLSGLVCSAFVTLTVLPCLLVMLLGSRQDASSPAAA